MEQQLTSEAEVEKLKKRLKELEDENSSLKRRLNEARDPSPVKRPSRKRVHRLLMDAGIYLFRSGNWWVVKFGRWRQHYRKLTQIWKLVAEESWDLEKLFPYPSEFDTPPEEKRTRKLAHPPGKPQSDPPPKEKCTRKLAHPPRKPQRNPSLFDPEFKQKMESVGREETARIRGETELHFMDSLI